MTWRRPRREDHQVAWLWAGCVLILAGLAPIARALAQWLPVCAWHVWTGLPCPGCGTTRAMLDLTRGDIPGAVAMNPLATVFAFAFGLGGLGAPVWLGAGGRVPVPAPGPKPLWIAVCALSVLSNWCWLVASGV